MFSIARCFPPILDLNRVLSIFDSEGDFMGKVIAIHTFSNFEWRFRVPKFFQCKLCHSEMSFMGDSLIPERSFLMGLQVVE